MTPGELDIPIYKGSKWSFTFQFIQTANGNPVNLTGAGPFVCEVKKLREDQILATATVTSDYDATGTVTITLSTAQTGGLPIGKVRMGVRDANNNPYLEGTPEVKWFTPT